MSYQEKLKHCAQMANKKLLQIIITKQTNLAVSLDLTTKKELLYFAEMLAPYVCMIKTHIDIVEDFDWDLINQLKKLSEQYQFAIFEDRKFADIGNTVRLQYNKGIYRISEWANFINAHLISGPGIIQALGEICIEKNCGLLLLAQMSSKENLISPAYTKKNIQYALQYPEYVSGFICQEKITNDPRLLHFTPGIKMNSEADSFDQQYLSPEKAFKENKIDIAIVGRGIYQSENPIKEAQLYQKCCWESYCL